MARGDPERLPSGKYRVRWYTRDGRHPSKTFTTKRDAERFRQRAIVDSERAGMDIAKRGATVQGLIDAWWATKERSVKPRTAERYELHKRYIEKRLGSVSLREFSYERIQDLIDDAAAAYSPATVSGIYGVLALVIKDAVRRGRLPGEFPKPVLPHRSKPVLTVPTLEQVEALALASDARLYAPVILAGYCGLREGELLALRRGDIEMRWSRRGTEDVLPHVLVHRARNKSTGAIESTKTERVRRVHMPDRVYRVLVNHLEEYPGDLLVPCSASVLQKSWERARIEVGLEAVRFHDLRHAAASLMIAAGLSVKQVSTQLGHANATQTLDTYSHLWPDAAADAIRKMDAYLSHEAISTSMPVSV